MSEKLHVIPQGDHWEVETQGGTPMTLEKSKEEAVRQAKEIARNVSADEVILHDGDGVTEAIAISEAKP